MSLFSIKIKVAQYERVVTVEILILMQKTRLPEHLENVRGLFYSPTTENLSGQMALTAGFASVEELKSFQTKSRSKNRSENKYWFKADQMAIAAGFASVEELTSFRVRNSI